MSDDDRLIDELRAALDEGAEQLPSTPPPFGQGTAAGHRPRGIGRWRLPAIAAAAIVFVAGGAVMAINANDTGNTPTAATQPLADVAVQRPQPNSAGTPGVITIIATVIEEPGSRPRLCTYVLNDVPPCLEGAPITNWDWSAVVSEEANGTRWGEYVVVGHFDDTFTEFTLSERPRRATPDDYEAISESENHSTACPPPEGGWSPSPSSTTVFRGEHMYTDGPAEGHSSAQFVDGYGGSWWDTSTGVLNVRIVGDHQDREEAAAEIAEYYPDPLCILAATRTWEELHQIKEEIDDEYADLDNSPITKTRVATRGPAYPSAFVEIQLSAPDRALIEELYKRYGGAIHIDSR